MLQEIKEQLVVSSEAVTKVASYYHTHKDEIKCVSEAFEKINVTNARATQLSIDLGVTGNKHMLAAVFSAFRKMGYAPGSRPGPEAQSSFCCYWNHPDHDLRFWLNFTSDKCTRVKTGTETIERDIYEVVCE